MPAKRKQRRSRSSKKVTGKYKRAEKQEIAEKRRTTSSKVQNSKFSTALLLWFKDHARVFFWREEKLTSFQSLVVELLLQKTRAETVEKFIRGFLKRYPDPESVNKAETSDLEEHLEPLGLSKRRANHLKEISKNILEKHGGNVPMEYAALTSMKGVGPYIANAVICFNGGIRKTVIDSNVIRIITRYFDLPVPMDVRRPGKIAEVLDDLLPEKEFSDFNYALLDLGALICLPRKPYCQECPLMEGCQYYLRNIKKDSRF
ncbi:MAG: A/G-specific adenine glycosylase [Candidatus Odinarchaeota archaeon]